MGSWKSALAALTAWLKAVWPSLRAFLAGLAVREYVEAKKEAKQSQKRAEALSRALSARRRVERMSDDEVTAELRRRLPGVVRGNPQGGAGND